MFRALVEAAGSGGFQAVCWVEDQDGGERLRSRLFASEQEARSWAHAEATARGFSAVQWEDDDP